ncbi:DUF6461 domain-containing protein [Streptosporangium sp. NPDC049248]|uniref:DUF6461 domain-containing protein n=1 Tax=Streptosporangium sp. NPDC049248 TaxID=3155651 RepID=UPI00344AEEF3
MREDDFTHYERLVSAWFSDPTCLTWCEASGLDDVARAFGADLAAAESLSFEDAQLEQCNADIPGILPSLVAGTIGDWTLVVEPNGCEGARPEVLKALSARGRAVNVLLNGGQYDRLSYAAAGRLLAVRLTSSPARPGRLPGDADAVIDSVIDSVGTDDVIGLQAASLLAAEHITGARLTEEWLLDSGLTRLLVENPLPDDIVPDQLRNHRVLNRPEVRAILDDLSPGKVAPIRYLMTEAVVQGSQLLHPTVDEALEFLRGDDDTTRRREVRRQVALLCDDVSREPGPDWTPRRAAVKVLLDALGDDLTKSADAVAGHAYMGHLTDDQKTIVVIMKRCLHRISRTAS